MILDKLENWPIYFNSEPWQEAFAAIHAITAETPLGDHPVCGEDIVLKLAEGNTEPEPSRRFEAHRDFIDIQVLLNGEEFIDWTPVDGLPVTEDYNAERDVEFYGTRSGATRMALRPGLFAVFFPGDAHRPGIHPPAGENRLRKIVVKLRRSIVMNAPNIRC